MAATLSASWLIDGLLFCACRTISTMRAKAVSLPTRVAS